MSDFEWEDRYLVLKRKDIDSLPVATQQKFWALLDEAIDLLPEPEGGPREFLVIEADWPEYEPAAAMLQARIEKEGL